MKPQNILLAALAASVLCVATLGCGHTISKTQKTSVNSNGTMTSKETTVTQNADGTVTKTEETKKTSR